MLALFSERLSAPWECNALIYRLLKIRMTVTDVLQLFFYMDDAILYPATSAAIPNTRLVRVYMASISKWSLPSR